jgi:hypothetical protein
LNTLLVIPVFRGGQQFKDCLLSIQGKEALFGRIIVSINGSESERAADKRILASVRLDTANLMVIETQKSLEDVDHSIFILKRISESGVKPDTPIMNLFHDDWLLRGPVELGSGSVVFGDWERTKGPSPVSGVTGDSQEVGSWLEDQGRRAIFMNGSGMIATLGVMQDVAVMMRIFKSGVRYEHMLLTHRSVKLIEKVNPSLVKIRIHDQQAGSNKSAFQCLRGDLAFVFWLVLQGRVFSFRGFRYLIGALVSGFYSFALRLSRKSRQYKESKS